MGYNRELFVDKVDENLICGICLDVLQDPYTCKDGHSFCKDCITQWLKTSQTCPIGNDKLQASNLVRTLIVHNMVQNLEVWCHPPEKYVVAASVESLEKKCGWRGKLQSLSKHRETCPFQQVQCPNENCKEIMQRRELKDHDRICKYKEMECNECRKRLVRHELQGHTANECPETLIPCPNKCTKQRQGQIQLIKRVDLDSHLQNICHKTILDCPFKDQGCSVKVERQYVDKHVQDNMAAHMMLLVKENNQLKEELTRVKEKQEEEESSYSGRVQFEINVFQNGGYYNHSKYGHLLYVPPNTVTKPTKITCKVYNNYPIFSPAAKFTEVLASYVVELGPPSLNLQKPIIVTLLHSGPIKKHGYEITVRSINIANDSWEEIDVLKKDSHAPDHCKSHYLQVSLKKLSTLAVVTRLYTDRFQVTPRGCIVRSSVYDDVTLEFPKGAVEKTFEGTMKILPENIVIEDNIIGSPALLFHGFQGLVFSKPVKIKVPFESSKTPGSHPRLLRLDFDSQFNGQWESVTNFKIEHGFMEFSVYHFSAFWPLMTLNASAKYVIDRVNACYRDWFNPRSDVSFAAYMRKGQTWQDLDLQLTCVALDKQEALTDRMEGNLYTSLVECTGDQPMRCREKAHLETEGLSDWDKDFFLQFLGENKECSKQFCGTAERDSIKLRYYNDLNGRQPKNRLCILTLKTKLEGNIGDSWGSAEYFGISLEVLKESPEDIAIAMMTSRHLKVDDINLANWNTKGVLHFYSSLPRKEECFNDLIKCLRSLDGGRYLSCYLEKGHELVTSPLKSLENEVQNKVIDIVARNIDYYGSRLAKYLDVSKEFVEECKKKFSGAEQAYQILRKWVVSSDTCTIEKLFRALRYLRITKAEAELANYTTKLSIENAQA